MLSAVLANLHLKGPDIGIANPEGEAEPMATQCPADKFQHARPLADQAILVN
jgi:hypothetical protein